MMKQKVKNLATKNETYVYMVVYKMKLFCGFIAFLLFFWRPFNTYNVTLYVLKKLCAVKAQTTLAKVFYKLLVLGLYERVPILKQCIFTDSHP